MGSDISKIIFNGSVLHKEKNVEIVCVYASIASLFVKFQNGERYQKGTKFADCSLNIRGKIFNFGMCEYLPDKVVPDFDGRLVFIENIYDFYSTISNKKLLDIQAYFQGLPLMLAQKNHINKEFREYLTDLSFDLSVYKKIFDDIDFKHRNEPESVFQFVQQAVIKTEGRNYFSFFNSKLAELKRIVRNFSKEEHSLHGYYLRRQVWDIISASKFILRSNVRPRGYSGDSMMMSLIYENKYVGDSTFGKLMHFHPLQTQAAQAVRNRMRIVPQYLHELEKTSNYSTEKFRVMSLACGPAMEMENIILSSDSINRYDFTLLDQDHEALYEASENIARIEQRFGHKLNYTLICDSVRTLISAKDLSSKWGKFHFIYSMGLFDYISQRVAVVILKKIYQTLEPGGVMLIGNFHLKNESRIYMEYWADWTLNYRTESDLLALADGLLNAETEIFFENTGIQMFLQIRKKYN